VQGKELLNHSGIRNRGYVEVYLGFPHILFLIALSGWKGVVELDGNSHRTQMKMARGGEKHEHNLHDRIYVCGQTLEMVCRGLHFVIRNTIGTTFLSGHAGSWEKLKEYLSYSFNSPGRPVLVAKTSGRAPVKVFKAEKAFRKGVVNKL